ncbi:MULTISPECIES: NAD-dependent epimerase/dehydratase family protein [unclassified Prochlorococcus]|uniref:NAD-dependent epimerase/dehydratase family protein n=1 Tax=unclassified Prochlorococcus TaxID=2627481 RepID=UPI00097CCCAE|nr:MULTISPECIES: NAD-dependent epimerase/dehydratase family protein [unclassified Prochlorococcus]AQL29779.1 hypothetical protein BSR22_00660 [Prochlorococcus sp. RS50]AQL31590.1 hypothetical protein BS620_00815 [Prochlorococcus sp. RS01]AQL34542.1 hypothetical protein BS621_07135 [Prochlorococcus sp. RS04]
MKNILITGGAGFIGSALIIKLLENGHNVIAIDNINSYYDQKLKIDRINHIEETNINRKSSFKFYKLSISDKSALTNLFESNNFDTVVHLAAQAGVRHSIDNPDVYFHSNLLGFGNVIEEIRRNNVSNFIFASSSSVYGGNEDLPFKESHIVDTPVSLYAATKKSNELMAYSYSHLYGIPTTGLRFFTVYGPWGRPDMAPMKFTKAILEGRKIKVFNFGKMKRDFTYIDDVVEGILKCCFKPATSNKVSNNLFNSAPYRIFNLGNGQPVELMDFINILENSLGIKSKKEFIKMQQGDVVQTWANTSSLSEWIGYSPKTSIKDGVDKFTRWYKEYYGF